MSDERRDGEDPEPRPSRRWLRAKGKPNRNRRPIQQLEPPSAQGQLETRRESVTIAEFIQVFGTGSTAEVTLEH